MNKGDLVDALEAKLGSRKAATEAVESLIDTIVRTVARGERVAISGFGTFEKAARAARTGRNPRTGDTVKIRKTSVPKFKPGTAFKAYVAAPSSLPKTAVGSGAVTSRVSKSAAAPAKSAAKTTRATKAAPAKSAARSTAKTAKAAPARATTATRSTAKKAAPARATKATATKATPTRSAGKTTAKRAAKKA